MNDDNINDQLFDSEPIIRDEPEDPELVELHNQN